jgi:hypothetical protein
LGSNIDGEAVEDYSGWSVSLNSAGDRVAIGAIYNDGNGNSSGSVKIYEYDGTTWNLIGEIDGGAAGDVSGWSVSLNSTGDRVAIGVMSDDTINGAGSGSTKIYQYTGTGITWNLIGELGGEAANEFAGYSVSLNSTGDRVAMGAINNDNINGAGSGSTKIYEYTGIGTNWNLIGEIDGEAANDQSGWSVSLNGTGDRVAIGAPTNDGTTSNSSDNRGTTRIYQYNGTTWNLIGEIDGEAANDQSGYSVSLNSTGDRVAIGAIFNDGTSGSDRGSTRIYDISNIANVTPINTTTAITITPDNQLGINTGSFSDTSVKLSVSGGISLAKYDGTGIKSVLENASYNDVYTYNNLLVKPNGANTRIFNLSGTKDSPLSGVNSNYMGWSAALYPYVGGSVSDGFGALGQGGVASINLGYGNLQTVNNLQGVITFNTLCAAVGDPSGTPERMRITPAGNIGIGTNDPKSRLHVVGDSDKDINFLTNGTLGAYNKTDATYAYGFVSVNREHTLFGGNLSLSGETALPIYRKGTNNKAGAGILIKNTNGPGVIPVTKFVYALDTDDASYTVSDSMVISGSNVTIPGDLYLTGTFYGNAAYRALTANWQGTYTTVSSNSANYESVFTTVKNNSGDWSYQGLDLKVLSGNWESTYSTVSLNSANWSYQGLDLKALTGNYDSTFTTVKNNSANWSYQGLDLKALSGNWQNTYTTLSSNSANWSYQGLDLKALTGNYDSTFTTVKNNSALWGAGSSGGSNVSGISGNWQNTYVTVSSNSASWSYQGLDLKALSGNWQNTYTTVSSNSANWSYQGLDLKALSGNWQNTYTTVQTNSSLWGTGGMTTEEVQDTVSGLLSAGKGITLRYADADNKLEISTTANLSTSMGLNGGFIPIAFSSNRLEDSVFRNSGLTLFCSLPDAAIYTGGSNSPIYTQGANSHIYTNSGNISSTTGNLFLSAGSVFAPKGTVSAASASFVNLSAGYTKLKSYTETNVVASNTTGTCTIDLSLGTVFTHTLDASITTGFQLQNIPIGVNSFLITLTQDSTGGRTVNWNFIGKTVKWSGGAPTVSSTANATDIYSFMSIDGNTWYGSVAGKNFV